MTHNKIVYFVVVSWNNADIILECMESIKQQSYPHIKTVLIDNNSSDETASLVKNKYPTVTIIENKNNEGFAIANNQGIELALQDANCSYVALLNSDARIDVNWTDALVKFESTRSNVASMQAITLDYYDHDVIDSRGIKVDPKGRAIQLGYRESRADSYTEHKVFGVNAAACIYTASFLRKQPFSGDYFDSDLWMYLEDVDLAARATMLGYDNWVVPGAFAYHMGSASSSKNPGFSVFYIYRNNLLMLLKNFPVSMLIKALPGVIYNDINTCIGLLRTKNYRVVKALLKGRIYSFRYTVLFIKKRKVVRGRQNTTSKHLMSLMKAS